MRRTWFSILNAFLLLATAGLMFGGQLNELQPGEEAEPNQWIVRLAPTASAGAVLGQAAAGAQFKTVAPNNTHLLTLPPNVPASTVANIAARGDVLWVEPNRIRRTTVGAPSDTMYSQQWALTTIQALNGWTAWPNSYTVPASGRVKVAILDTGADCTHPDFANAAGTSTDSAQGGQLSFTLSRAPVATVMTSPACPWLDDHGHGTHTAGTVAATTNNARGVASLGYPLELVIYKVLNNSGSGSDATIAGAIISAVDAGVRVVSMSLGGSGYSQTLQDAVNYAWSHNVVVAAAAGNSNSSSLFFPAGANFAVGVASISSNGAKSSFSNWGPSVDIAAPGSSIVSTYPTYPRGGSTTLNYATMSGTSMATPHVAAMAGMIAMNFPSLPAASVVTRLQQSAASTIAGGGWDQYLGYGVLNAAGALGGSLRPATVGGITGQVVNTSQLPVANATVSVAGQTQTLNSTGLFRFSNLAAGSYSLVASAASLPTRTMTVTVLPGADTALMIVLGAATATAQGTVTSGGSPLAGATIEALQGSSVIASAMSAIGGGYSLSVSPGAYDLRASAPGKIPSTVSNQSFSQGQTRTVNLDLHSLGVITGTVRNEAYSPVSGVQVNATGPQSSGAYTYTSGVYRIQGLAAGTYQLSVSASGYRTATATAAAANDLTTTVNFNLVPVTVTVTPAAVTLSDGQTRQFSATVDGATSQAVLWSRNPAVGSISAAGLYTAPNPVDGAQTVTITATSSQHPTRVGTATVTLQPAVAVSSLKLWPTSVIGGASASSNQVTLTKAAPTGGVTVTLTSSDPAAVPPASVVVPAGATKSPFFTITTSVVNASRPVTITANCAGSSKSAVLTVNPVSSLSSVSVSPSTVVGGVVSGHNRVYLTRSAPAGGAPVTLTSSDPSTAAVPATALVPEGATVVYFAITTSAVLTPRQVTITGFYGGVSKSVTLTVNPIALSSITLASSTVTGGVKTTTNLVYLDSPAPAGGITVNLSSSDPSAVPSAAVTVPAGATRVYFTITTYPVSVQKQAIITGTYNGVSKSVTLTVKP